MTPPVFFDLDGTLTDPAEGITRCIQFAIEALDMQPPPAESLHWCIGPPLLESLKKLVGANLADQALVLYRQRFAEVGWRENKPYAGIENVLKTFGNTGAMLYVATSKPRVFAEPILQHFALLDFFSGVYGSELDGTRSAKAELLEYALSTEKVAARAVMIGDRSHDIVGATANGMYAVGVTYGYGSETELVDAGADEVVASPSELCDAFARFRGVD